MASPVISYDEGGYHFVETSPEWKELCTVLPCFKQVAWPDYATEVREVEIDGKPLVIQLWKGWCQQFLGRDDFPGGIGGEVGVYQRVDGEGFPTERPDFMPSAMWTVLHEMSKHADGHFWWPVKEQYEIEFTFRNPVNGNVVFHAGPEKTYWLNKWMDTNSYHRYQRSQGKRWSWLPAWFPKNSNTPGFAEDYVLEYRINGENYPAW